MSDDSNARPPDTGQEPHVMPEATAPAVTTPPAPPAPPAPPVPPVAQEPAPGDGAAASGRGWRKGGVVFGGALVLIGLFALFGGLTSALDLLRLWPLLIVFGGIMEIVNPGREVLVKRIAEGLGSVAFGLVLVGNTLGYIPWTVWFSVASLWPILIVALGVELVGRGVHADWLRACSNILLILALAYGVFVLQPGSARMTIPLVMSSSSSSAAFSDSRPHDQGVSVGSASIKIGATRFTLGAGDVLAGIAGRSPKGESPKLSATVAGSSAAVTIGDQGSRTVVLGLSDRSLDVVLDRTVKWSEIGLDVGAVSGEADLSGLDVAKVRLNSGASDIRIKVGTLASNVAVDITGGATSVTVLVPAGASCTVDSKSGVSSVSVPSSFRQTSGIAVLGNSTFVSEGSGRPAIAISLTSGVSDLRIETY